jgi:hypothetical protein
MYLLFFEYFCHFSTIPLSLLSISIYSTFVLDQTANIKSAVVKDLRRLSEKEKHENQLISLSLRTSQGMITKDDCLFPCNEELKLKLELWLFLMM